MEEEKKALEYSHMGYGQTSHQISRVRSLHKNMTLHFFTHNNGFPNNSKLIHLSLLTAY